jgi:hypothetical protein
VPEWDGASGEGSLLVVALDPPDRFPADDVAPLYLAPEPALRVVLAAPGFAASPRLADALRALGSRIAPDAKLARTDAPAAAFADADVVLCEGPVPEALPPGMPVLQFDAPASVAEPGTVRAPLLRPVLPHPVLAGADPTALRPVAARVVAARPTDLVLAAAEEGPVIVCGERAGVRTVRVGLSPDDPAIALEPFLPVLVRNALAWLARPPLLPPQTHSGDALALREPVPGGVDRVWISGPGDASPRPVAVVGGAVVEAVPPPPALRGTDPVARARAARLVLELPPQRPATVVFRRTPAGFRLDPAGHVASAGAAGPADPDPAPQRVLAGFRDRSGFRDTRVRRGPLLAAAAAAALVLGGLLLRRGGGLPGSPGGASGDDASASRAGRSARDPGRGAGRPAGSPAGDVDPVPGAR